MKLTPLDIRHREFRRVVRGYSDEEVDVFLDDVADEFERLFQENIELQEKVQALEDQLAQLEGIKETLQKTLVSAQQQADEMKANARKESELIIKDAELKSRDIINQSYQDKQAVQQSLIQLKQAEDDFRLKFRSLLEAHLSLLHEEEASEEREEFRGLVAEVEDELSSAQQPEEHRTPDAESASESMFAAAGGEDRREWEEPGAPVHDGVDHNAEDDSSPEDGSSFSDDDFYRRESDDEGLPEEGLDEEPPEREHRESAIRRFFLGGEEKPSEEESEDEEESAPGFFEKGGRDFEW